MVQISPQSLNLEEFLKLPETKPASEYINGEIINNFMPKIHPLKFTFLEQSLDDLEQVSAL